MELKSECERKLSSIIADPRQVILLDDCRNVIALERPISGWWAARGVPRPSQKVDQLSVHISVSTGDLFWILASALRKRRE